MVRIPDNIIPDTVERWAVKLIAILQKTMMRTVVCISVCFLALLTLATAQSSTGTCSATDQTRYVTQELSLSCGINLGTANSSMDSNAVDAALDVVCTDECGGELSEWLLNQCSDTIGAAGLYYWCLNTNGTAAFSRCRFASQPFFNAMSSLGGTAPCFIANETNPCPMGCDLALMGITNLGCCYQSLYNNTAYLQGILSAGFLTQEQYQALQGLSNPLLWAACQVVPPAMQCTSEGIEFPTASSVMVTTSFAAVISVHLCAMILLLAIALYMLF